MDAGERVQGAQRLIQQQDLRPVDERPGNGHALGHPAGKLVGVGFFKPLQAHQADVGGNLPPAGFVDPARHKAGSDVLLHRQPGEKGRVLEHQAPLVPRAGHRRPVQPHFAGARLLQTGDDAQQGGFSASAGADDRNEASRLDGQPDVLQRGHLPAVLLDKAAADVPNLDSARFGHHFISPFCQTRTLSRILNSSVMMVEKIRAMSTRLA